MPLGGRSIRHAQGHGACPRNRGARATRNARRSGDGEIPPPLPFASPIRKPPCRVSLPCHPCTFLLCSAALKKKPDDPEQTLKSLLPHSKRLDERERERERKEREERDAKEREAHAKREKRRSEQQRDRAGVGQPNQPQPQQQQQPLLQHPSAAANLFAQAPTPLTQPLLPTPAAAPASAAPFTPVSASAPVPSHLQVQSPLPASSNGFRSFPFNLASPTPAAPVVDLIGGDDPVVNSNVPASPSSDESNSPNLGTPRAARSTKQAREQRPAAAKPRSSSRSHQTSADEQDEVGTLIKKLMYDVSKERGSKIPRDKYKVIYKKAVGKVLGEFHLKRIKKKEASKEGQPIRKFLKKRKLKLMELMRKYVDKFCGEVE